MHLKMKKILKGTAEMEAEMRRFRKGPASVRLHTPMFWDTADAAGSLLKARGRDISKHQFKLLFFIFYKQKSPQGLQIYK